MDCAGEVTSRLRPVLRGFSVGDWLPTVETLTQLANRAADHKKSEMTSQLGNLTMDRKSFCRTQVLCGRRQVIECICQRGLGDVHSDVYQARNCLIRKYHMKVSIAVDIFSPCFSWSGTLQGPLWSKVLSSHLTRVYSVPSDRLGLRRTDFHVGGDTQSTTTRTYRMLQSRRDKIGTEAAIPRWVLRRRASRVSKSVQSISKKVCLW